MDAIRHLASHGSRPLGCSLMGGCSLGLDADMRDLVEERGRDNLLSSTDHMARSHALQFDA